MCHLNDLQCLELEQLPSTVVQHYVEVVYTAAVFVDHAAVWETVDAELVCAVPVADSVACRDNVGALAVLGCNVGILPPVVLDCSVVETVLGAPVCCTLGDIAVVFGCTVEDCHFGVGSAFAVACQFGRSAPHCILVAAEGTSNSMG